VFVWTLDDLSPRLQPGITQEAAPNESQRGLNAAASEALIYKALFVAPWVRSRFGMVQIQPPQPWRTRG